MFDGSSLMTTCVITFHQFFNTLIFCASLSCKWILKCSIFRFHALLYLERFYVLHCAESKMTVWRVAVSLFVLWSFYYCQIAIKHLISILKRGFYIWILSFDGWDTALSGENGNLPLLRYELSILGIWQACDMMRFGRHYCIYPRYPYSYPSSHLTKIRARFDRFPFWIFQIRPFSKILLILS